MEMLVLDDAVTDALIAERKRLGLDKYDEVHAGRYIVMAIDLVGWHHRAADVADGLARHLRFSTA